MWMNEVVVDSSFLYALYSKEDRHHGKAIDFSRNVTMRPIIPDVVLPEVAFLFRREGSVFRVTEFLKKFAKEGVEPYPINFN
jgi:predicted nucleic acid-binding protein